MVSTPESELSGVAAVLTRFQRIITWFETNWAAGTIIYGLLPTGLVGLAMAWLAYLTDIVKPYAPLIYGIAALSGALATALTLALFGVFRQRMAGAAMRRASINTTKSVNYLDDYFNKMAIKIIDFEPMYGPYNGKKFVDCDIIGPAVIILSGQMSFKDVAWGRTDAILIEDKNPTLHNAILFDGVSFERCRFFSITLLMQKRDEPMFKKFLANQPVSWLNRTG